MKIKSLLKLASKCETDQDADNLYKAIKLEIRKIPKLSNLLVLNVERVMEEETPLVSFELVRVISAMYLTAIRLEIRSGSFTISVITSLAKDRLGISSETFEILAGMDVLIEPLPEQTLSQVMKQAVEIATANHSELIQEVGVKPITALAIARKSW